MQVQNKKNNNLYKLYTVFKIRMDNLKVTRNFKNQITGFIDEENKTYITSWKTSEHFFRLYRGFGMDDKTITLLNELGIKIIKIPYQGKIYRLFKCYIEQYIKSPHKYINREEGEYNPQTFVPVAEMHQENENEKKIVQKLLIKMEQEVK